MRIAIREQLGLLVLLTSLIALAVVAIATVSMPLVVDLHYALQNANRSHSGWITIILSLTTGKKTITQKAETQDMLTRTDCRAFHWRRLSMPANSIPTLSFCSQVSRLYLPVFSYKAPYSVTKMGIIRSKTGLDRLWILRALYLGSELRRCSYRHV